MDEATINAKQSKVKLLWAIYNRRAKLVSEGSVYFPFLFFMCFFFFFLFYIVFQVDAYTTCLSPM